MKKLELNNLEAINGGTECKASTGWLLAIGAGIIAATIVTGGVATPVLVAYGAATFVNVGNCGLM
jgi:hypothetical protein